MGFKTSDKIKKILCFDLDNTLCVTKESDYKNSRPIKKKINLVNKLFKQNYYIIIYTARYMGRFKGNKNKVLKYGYKKTINQLKSWNLSFNELHMCKPTYDYWIDDKSIFFKKNWENKLLKILKLKK